MPSWSLLRACQIVYNLCNLFIGGGRSTWGPAKGERKRNSRHNLNKSGMEPDDAGFIGGGKGQRTAISSRGEGSSQRTDQKGKMLRMPHSARCASGSGRNFFERSQEGVNRRALPLRKKRGRALNYSAVGKNEIEKGGKSPSGLRSIGKAVDEGTRNTPWGKGEAIKFFYRGDPIGGWGRK